MTNLTFYAERIRFVLLWENKALTTLAILHKTIGSALANAPAAEDAVVKATVARETNSV